nr:hypothetical protein Q903MT_gene201 [Picea sitchensis]
MARDLNMMLVALDPYNLNLVLSLRWRLNQNQCSLCSLRL